MVTGRVVVVAGAVVVVGSVVVVVDVVVVVVVDVVVVVVVVAMVVVVAAGGVVDVTVVDTSDPSQPMTSMAITKNSDLVRSQRDKHRPFVL
ncbi:MAG: hypothetical protein WEF28_05270 [Acidimicrobiia bacterium]